MLMLYIIICSYRINDIIYLSFIREVGQVGTVGYRLIQEISDLGSKLLSHVRRDFILF